MTDNVVKSVRRVFEILEMFERERRPLVAMEIARELGYPHTSTLALLKSMAALGYLSHDRGDGWTFAPTYALPELTDWINESLHGETGIMEVMATLHKATGETINLSRQSGEFIKIIYGIESTKNVSISVRRGVLMPINASHTGMVSLSSLSDEEIAGIIRKLQSNTYPEARSMTVKEAFDEIHEIRKAQFSPGYDMHINGIGAVCFAVRAAKGRSAFVIGVVGPTDRIRAEEKGIIAAAKEALKANDVGLAYPKSTGLRRKTA